MIIKNVGYHQFVEGITFMIHGRSDRAYYRFILSSDNGFSDSKFIVNIVCNRTPICIDFETLFRNRKDALSLFIVGCLRNDVVMTKKSADLGCSHACYAIYRTSSIFSNDEDAYLKKAYELNHPLALFQMATARPLKLELMEKSALNGCIEALDYLISHEISGVKWLCLQIKYYGIVEGIQTNYYVDKVIADVICGETTVQNIYLIGKVSQNLISTGGILTYNYYKRWNELARVGTLRAMCIFRHRLNISKDLVKVIGEWIWSTRSDPWFPEIFFE